LKNYATFQIYTIILDLTQFDTDNPWAHLFSVGGWQKVTSLSCRQSHVWITLAI